MEVGIAIITILGVIILFIQAMNDHAYNEENGITHASGRKIKSNWATNEQRARKRRQYYRRTDPTNPMADWEWWQFEEHDKAKRKEKILKNYTESVDTLIILTYCNQFPHREELKDNFISVQEALIGNDKISEVENMIIESEGPIYIDAYDGIITPQIEKYLEDESEDTDDLVNFYSSYLLMLDILHEKHNKIKKGDFGLGENFAKSRGLNKVFKKAVKIYDEDGEGEFIRI